MTASVPPAPGTEATPPDDTQTGMTHRQRINALVGLLLGMFVAFLSSTIVSNALPTIIIDLHGTQDQYTWVVTATLLASTATTPPIWGQVLRPGQQETAGAAGAGPVHRRIGARRPVPIRRDAHRLPRDPGPRPRWPAGTRRHRRRVDVQPPASEAATRGPSLR